MSGPILETERLILRPTAPEDFEGWAKFMGDAEASRFIGGPQSPSHAWRGFLQVAGAWKIQGYSMFSVVEKSSGRWIGRLGPWNPLGWPGTEVGWGIIPEFQGKGFALEGSIAAMDYAADVLKWPEIVHTIAPDNIPSQAVARRLGSTILRRTNLPAPFEDQMVDVWGQTRDEWTANRARF